MSAPPGFARRSDAIQSTAPSMQHYAPTAAGFGSSGHSGGAGSLAASSHAAFDDGAHNTTILPPHHSSFVLPSASDSWIGGGGGEQMQQRDGPAAAAPFGGRGFSEAHATSNSRSYAPHAGYEQMQSQQQQSWVSGDMSLQSHGAPPPQQDTLFDRTTSGQQPQARMRTRSVGREQSKISDRSLISSIRCLFLLVLLRHLRLAASTSRRSFQRRHCRCRRLQRACAVDFVSALVVFICADASVSQQPSHRRFSLGFRGGCSGACSLRFTRAQY